MNTSFDIRNSAFEISPRWAMEQIVEYKNDTGNGYIWHTTCSGKTLTSFKVATLLKENEHINKCDFVVARKVLYRQTHEEFNRFQEGCVEENTHTAALIRRLLSANYAGKLIAPLSGMTRLILANGSPQIKKQIFQRYDQYCMGQHR